MPRKRPAELRSYTTVASRLAEERGLAAITADALDRLGQPGLDPLTVADELQRWREVVQLPMSTLAAPHNDWVEFIGPSARSVLDDAVQALNWRAGAPLRAELARLDPQFERKTSHNPLAVGAAPPSTFSADWAGLVLRRGRGRAIA